MTDMEAIALSVRRSGVVNIILWVATMLIILFCVAWVLVGGPEEKAGDRADAVGKLWTVLGPWVLGLAAKSKFTGDQKTAVAQASQVLHP